MLPKYQPILADKASREIDEICKFIAANSAQGAETVAREFAKVIESLGFLPYRNRVYERRKDPKLAVRTATAFQYILYYRINEQALTVEIFTVRHGARRQPKRFR